MPSHPSTNLADSSANRIVLAARISLVCPFLVFLMAMIANRIEMPSRIVVEIGAGIVALAGMSCGIAALALGRRHAGPAVAIQGGIGLLIGLGFVGVVLNSHFQAQHKAKAPAAGITGESPTQAGSSSDAQLLAEALARFVAKTTELEQRLVAAATPLGDPPVLDMSGVQSTAALASRRSMVESLLAASQTLSNHLAQSQTFIETELTKRGISAAEAQATATGFLKSFEALLSVSRQLRELEHSSGQALIQALDLLSQEWGSWKAQANGVPQFEKESASRQYAELLQRLDELEARDHELRKPTPAR